MWYPGCHSACGTNPLAAEVRLHNPWNHRAASVAEMLIKKCGDLSERLLGLRNPIVKLILSVRLPLIDFQLCVDASRSELPMHPHRIAQQQVACSVVWSLRGDEII